MSEQLLKKQTITIFGEICTIVSDEPVERLMRAAGLLNECMKQYAGRVDDKQRAVVLCALHAALESERFKEQLEQIKQKEQALTMLMERELDSSSSPVF